jgi:serine/threonine-protein kinase
MDDLVGQTLGQYQVIEVIGKGGMATVYRASQPRLKRDVAIKVMLSPLADNPTFRERFEREAQAIARLRHPNILSIHDYGETPDGRLYLVMDYVQGGILLDRMRDGMSQDDAIEIAAQVADALDYAHRQGIVHRDVKPSNILLTRDDRPLLADFGLAKPTQSDRQLTGGGLMLGTPDYIAPEQAKGLAIDGRIDIYALGVILFEMLTGRHPFAGDTPASVLVKHLTEPMPRPSEFNPAVLPALNGVVAQATAKSPDERYQKAGDLSHALRMVRNPSVTMLLSTSIAQEALLDEPRNVGTESDKRLRISPAIPASIAIIVVIALLIAIFAPRTQRPDPLDISSLCAIERQFVVPLSREDTSQYQSLLPYFEAANPQLFAHLEAVEQAYQDGQAQTEATYVMGAPGVGKSFVARALDQFPEDRRCEIALGDLFEHGVEKLAFEVDEQPDLATLEGDFVLNRLPTIAEPKAFRLEHLFLAGGCDQDGATVPLIIVDGLDELHSDSAMLILREVEHFVSQDSEEGKFVHVVVFGRPESFVPWLKHASRIPPDEVRGFLLEGPLYTTYGDLDFLVRNYYDFRGIGTPSQTDIDRFIQLVVEHPSLTYSIRKLATANFIIEQSAVMAEGTEQSLKDTLYDNLLERNYQTHGRTEQYSHGYEYALEEVAARYLAHVDQGGFFAVDFQDTVPIVDVEGELVGEVRVRDLLDRSGVALLDPMDAMSTRYQFDPFWLHAHLVEQRNQRLNPRYQYRSCEQSDQ